MVSIIIPDYVQKNIPYLVLSEVLEIPVSVNALWLPSQLSIGNTA